MLTLEGHESQIVHDGTTALAAARRHQPHVILCDIGLPGIDGYEVARQLRREPWITQVRLIAVSGYGQDDDRRRAREAGFDYHLVKPVQPETLLALLDSIRSERARPS
jgi:CheY-like chemotaxis protein